MEGSSRFFVIVFAIGGAIFTDYGWAPTPDRFYRSIRYRITHPERYRRYAGLTRTAFTRYEVRDITEFSDWRTRTTSARAIKRTVKRMERTIRQQPIM